MTQLHIQTPTILSPTLTRQSSREIWFKLENLQPSGSFKLRGIGALCQKLAHQGCTELVSSSGGNAGYSAAWAARELNLPIRVFLPVSTPQTIQQAMADLGAQLSLAGSVWDEAHAAATDYTHSRPGAALVHPFDEPEIWQGHATMIRESAAQMPQPDAVVLSVGGGGLLAGVLEGMHQVGWQNVPVWAVETEGAASYHQALAAGQPVRLEQITSIARTLGARQVCDQAFAWSQRHQIESVLVSDDDALAACKQFASEQRMLVEPACGAALSLVYHHQRVLPEQIKRVFVIVCGGIAVYPEL